jgi:UDP-GlcNAc:undecaprenyl-phosphate GlcNAc-1-phosphate transferase
MFLSRNFIFVGVFFCAFLLTHFLMPLVFVVGRKLKIVDHPGVRKIHDQPIIRCGGMAIFLAFWSVIFAGLVFAELFNQGKVVLRVSHLVTINTGFLRAHATLMGLFIGHSLIYVSGFIDDKFNPRFGLTGKWVFQFFAASLAVYVGIRIHFFQWEIINYLVSVIWIVGITNSFNLLDNMNGLSAGVAALCAGFLVWVSLLQEQYYVALVTLVLIGTLLAFLIYNFPRAKIFLGDQGALAIGYILACLSLLESYIDRSSSTHLGIFMPLFTLALPIFDTVSVMIIRLYQKRPLFVGDNNHLSHRLVRVGFSKVSAVLILYLLTIIFGIHAVILVHASFFIGILTFVQTLIVILIITVLMTYGAKKNHR